MKRVIFQIAAVFILASFCHAADTQVKDLTDGSGSVTGTWKVVCDNGTTTYICTANSLLALKIGTVTNAQVCVGDSSSKIQCTTDPNTWATAAHNHTGTYIPYSWIVQAGSNNVLTYTGDYSLGLTLTGNTSVTLPTSGTLATTSFKPSDLNITSQAAGDILYFNGTAWVRLAKDVGKYLKSGDSAVSWDTPAGGAGVDVSGTPANHYWTTWVDSDTIKGTSVTASKPVCTDSNGEPAVCAGTEGVWAALGQSNTFTENNTFGNADTDTLTLRSLLIGGNSRAVWIAGSAPTPTYATGTNELYVGGDVESGGNVYAANFVSTGTGESYIGMANNTTRSPTASAYEIYFEAGTDLKYNLNGTEKTVARLEDAQTFTGAKTFSDTLTLNRGATGAGQLVIAEDSDDGTNTVTITAQAMSASYTLTLPTTDGDSGQFLQTNGSGSLTWAAPTAAAAGSDTQVQFNDGGSALGGDAGFVFAKTTGTLTIGKNTVGGEVILYNELGATDYNATIQPNAAQAAAATITLPAATGTLIAEGLATGGIVLGDSTPDADGEIGYASNAYKLFANSEDLVLTASANLWTFSSATSATVAFTPSVALNGGASVGGTLALGANSITMSGSIGVTGTRVTKGWFTDVESTNMPTVGGTAILTSLTAPQFTTIELGHASDSTISRVSAGVLAIEGSNILTAGASPTLTGAWDFGGATSVEIPNGTGPTVDAAGEIAVDTTSDQLVYYGGAKRVLPYKQYASFVIPAPAATDDINLLKAPYGMTISAINCIVQGTTSVTGQLQECSSTGGNCADLDSDITCDADGAADDGSLTDSAIAANGWLRWKTTSVSGTPTFLTVTVTYSVVSD